VLTPPTRVAGRSGRGRLAFLGLDEIWAFEMRDRLTIAHARGRTFDIDLTLVELEHVVGPRFLRVHRSWLVALPWVCELDRTEGAPRVLLGQRGSEERELLAVPVAGARFPEVRRQLLEGTVGVRFKSGRPRSKRSAPLRH
jgi:DNA-binding LytR/AlgR family response regulator